MIAETFDVFLDLPADLASDAAFFAPSNAAYLTDFTAARTKSLVTFLDTLYFKADATTFALALTIAFAIGPLA